MRLWANLAFVVLATTVIAAPSVPIHRLSNGLNWAPDGTATGDHKFVTLYPSVQDGVNGLWCSDCACDANGLCMQGTAGIDGAFAFRRNGQWQCQCNAGTCFDCSDLLNCCQPDGSACTASNQCCDASCLNGLCQPCIPNSQPCSFNSDCCSAMCIDGTCNFCTVNGESCLDSTQCCSGICEADVCVSVTSTTSTSTSSSTSSSTSTLNTSTTTLTTTTSTSTSTTTSTTLCTAIGATQPHADQAPDWRSDARFLQILGFEEPNGTLTVDTSPTNNNMTGSNTIDATYAEQGCQSLQIPGANGNSVQCKVGNPCTPSDFYFVFDDFTVGGYFRIAAPPGSGQQGGLYGTVPSFFSPGWWLWVGNNTPVPGQHWIFQMVSTAVFQTVSSTAAPNSTWTHVVGRYDHGTQTASLLVNGVVDATRTSINALTNNGSALTLPIGVRNMIGNYDEAFVFHGVMADTDVCRIAVCGIDGWGCTCSGSTYTAAAKHASFGGPITCTLPACDKAGPS